MEWEAKIESLIKNIILLHGKNDQRQKMIETEYGKSKEALDQAGRLLNDTANNIKELAGDAITEAVYVPLKDFKSGVQQICREFEAISVRADKQQQEAAKRQKTLQWTVLTALALSAIISIGSSAWVMMYAKQEITRSEWIGDINKAVDKGKLSRCADGNGICANVKGKMIRLDK